MEFILFIKADHKRLYDLSPQEMQITMEKGSYFIRQLVANGQMREAGALDKPGILVEKRNDIFIENSLDEKQDELISYLLVKAKDLSEAVEIAKSDPRFDQPGWKIEVRSLCLS